MFIAYDVSIELIQNLRHLVPIIKQHDHNLADQIQRGATSISLNLNEGSRLTAGNKRKHFDIAHGSANEVKGALDLADAWGLVAAEATSEARRILDRLSPYSGA